MERVILHSDLNSFYASCETVANPRLRGRPVAVCGSEENRHGIVLASSPEAKRLGVKTGMIVREAKRLCPDIAILPPDMEKYRDASRLVRSIYSQYTNLQEPMGIDESFLDITGCECSKKGGEAVANEIRRRVLRESGLSVSVGVSWNKVFAKLGSDIKKPNAVTVVSRDNYKSLVWPLPAETLLMVGRATGRRLRGMGIRTIGELAGCDSEYLRARFGKAGLMLHLYANGAESSPVRREDMKIPEKSIGNSTTTRRDLVNNDDVRATLALLSESVGARLREAEYMGSVIEMSYRTTDLFWRSRQRTLRRPTDITSEILEASFDLFRETGTLPLRSLGVRASGLVSADRPEQLDFFDDFAKRDRQRALDRTIDSLRRSFGFSIIGRGVALSDPDLESLSGRCVATARPAYG